MSGWIKLHRSTQESAIASHPEYLAVWVHLLMRAQYSDSECVIGRSVLKLNPGQLVFGRIKFASQVGISEAKVRAALDVMKSLNMITIKSMAKFSIISITNWKKYQDDNQQISAESPASNHQAASNQPASDHIQEGKESKEGEEIKKLLPASQEPAAPEKPAKVIVQLDYSCWPDQPSDQVLTDWLAMRKRLKANVSQTVINRFATELVKARTYGYSVDQCLTECVTRNWRGFEVQWLLNSKQQSGGQNAGQPKSAIERHMQQYYPGRDNPGSGIRDVGGNASVIRGEVVEPVRGGAGRIGAMGIDFERFNEKPN